MRQVTSEGGKSHLSATTRNTRVGTQAVAERHSVRRNLCVCLPAALQCAEWCISEYARPNDVQRGAENGAAKVVPKVGRAALSPAL